MSCIIWKEKRHLMCLNCGNIRLWDKSCLHAINNLSDKIIRIIFLDRIEGNGSTDHASWITDRKGIQIMYCTLQRIITSDIRCHGFSCLSCTESTNICKIIFSYGDPDIDAHWKHATRNTSLLSLISITGRFFYDWPSVLNMSAGGSFYFWHSLKSIFLCKAMAALVLLWAFVLIMTFYDPCCCS